MLRRGEHGAPGPEPPKRGARSQVPHARTPSEVAIALAMDMITVLGDVVVHGWLRQGLELHGLRRTQSFQHCIKPLPRPLEQAAKPIDGDPVQG